MRPPAPLSAGYRRQYLHLAAVLYRRLQAVAEAHVLAVDVDVDEAAQAAVAVGEAVAQPGVLGVERLEDVADRLARHRDRRRAAGGGAQLGGQLDRDRHAPGLHAAQPGGL